VIVLSIFWRRFNTTGAVVGLAVGLLASIGLTIPLVIAVSLATGRTLVLGVDPADTVMLVLTLVTAMLTFSLPRTNVLLGAVLHSLGLYI